ncbi:MAG: oxidoreductase [Alphaproteobacteria bacterium]
MPWNYEAVADQSGRVAIVTGANTGLGFETAKGLAAKGADVVMACRNAEKAQAAADKIRADVPGAKLHLYDLDLASLASVRAFADKVLTDFDRIDLLINNAGVMMSPRFETEDGLEGQTGVNFIGHFALTQHLLDRVVATAGSRIVQLSSQAHRFGQINLRDFQFKKSYNPIVAYGQSKLACLIFMYELDRRFKAQGISTLSVAAHPGASSTDLPRHLPKFAQGLAPYIAQSPYHGAQPTLYAALGDDVNSGEYFGPDGLFEQAGKAVKVGSMRKARDEQMAKKLWEIAEDLSGVKML